MSHPRFAPMTANLLARKGHAIPSMMTAFPAPRIEPPPVVAVTAEPHSMSEQPAPHDPSRPKKLFVAFSHCEHERLAIAAVKTGLSRHQIVRDALDAYFERIVQDIGRECRCITGDCGKNC